MTIKDVYQKFLKIEDDLDLFLYRIDGVYVWERIRFQIFQKILIEIGLYDVPHTVKKFQSQKLYEKFRVAWTVLKDSVFHNPFLAKDVNFIFFGHPRRKMMPDGYYWDIYTDFLVNSLKKNNSITIETYYSLDHLRPAKTPSLYYDGIIHLLFNIKKPFYTPSEKQIKEFSDNFKQKIISDFDINIDIKNILIDFLTKRNLRLPVYISLLKKIKPELIFLTVSYGRKSLIEAAKSLNIPVVEIQHGIISKYHIGYSFEERRSKKTFPDYFFSFGDFWRDCVHFPISKKRVITVGYPFLDTYLHQSNTNEKNEQMVFISQGTIGQNLSKCAIETAKKFSGKVKIIYKLHPGEYARWKTEYPWLKQAADDKMLEVISGDDPNLYDLLASSKWLVGVYSTAIYEGIALGCIPFIVNLPGVDYMEVLIHKGIAKLVNSPEEIDLTFEPSKISRDYFFADNWQDNFFKGVNLVLNNKLYV